MVTACCSLIVFLLIRNFLLSSSLAYPFAAFVVSFFLCALFLLWSWEEKSHSHVLASHFSFSNCYFVLRMDDTSWTLPHYYIFGVSMHTSSHPHINIFFFLFSSSSLSLPHSLSLSVCVWFSFGFWLKSLRFQASHTHRIASHYTFLDPAFCMLPTFIIVIIAIVALVEAAAAACYYSSTNTSIARAFRATGLYFMIAYSFLLLLLLLWPFSLSLSLFLFTVIHTHTQSKLTPLVRGYAFVQTCCLFNAEAINQQLHNYPHLSLCVF